MTENPRVECTCFDSDECLVHDEPHARPMTWWRMSVWGTFELLLWALAVGGTAAGLLYLWFIASQG